MTDEQSQIDETPEAAGSPQLENQEMTPEQLAEAKEYGRIDLNCDLLDRAIDLAFLSIMAFLVAQPLDQLLQGYAWLADNMTLRLMVLFLITYGLHLCVSFPLSYYSGFVLEQRFDMSNQSRAAWLSRYAKRHALGIGFGLAMFVALYWMIWSVGPWWWLVAAGGFFVVSVVFGQLAPVLILPLFYKIEKIEQNELTDRLSKLTEGTGLNLEGVYRMDLSEESNKANAMLAGLGSTRRVLMGDTVLEQFTPEEIEVIFGHEIGHHVFGHIRKLILVGACYSAAGFWACDRILMAVTSSEAGHAELPIWTLPLLMLSITLFSMIVEPLQNAISRRYERQCDQYALEKTGLREAYVSAFRKLARLNKDDPDPHPLAVFLFHSHPPIAERVAMAEK